ncbi:MAG: transcription antitermination factor NusB [Akkermansiaceae bacterium]|nr:transcription antitermination factor NusB [Armatimonadota bacterium]
MRRNVRETALRVLYAMDAGKRSREDVMDDSMNASELDDRGRIYLQQLVAGTLDNRTAIDAALDKFATDFPTHRQAVVDRNILRLAAAEILFGVSDAPTGAVVNEAVELAKKYSTKDSGRFVNGVLGALVRDHVGIEVSITVPDDDMEDMTSEATATRFWGDPDTQQSVEAVPENPTPDAKENHV